MDRDTYMINLTTAGETLSLMYGLGIEIEFLADLHSGGVRRIVYIPL